MKQRSLQIPSPLPDDLDAFLAAREAQFPDIVPGTEKRIHWAGERGHRTARSVVYLHGFSATSEEIRPVPDLVAEALGANLHFTRLAGHGRGKAAMAEPREEDWWTDTAEALAVGRAIGEEVIVIATSTGGTLAAMAATEPGMIAGVKGIVFVSPNFRLKHPAARLLTLPYAEVWGPWVAGREIGFRALSEDQARFWTSRYPTRAAVPMGRLVKKAWALDYSGVRTPALFVFAEADTVVSADATRQMARRWGGPATLHAVTPGPDDDPFAHILAGDIVSPGGTAPMVEAVLDWARTL